MRSITIQKGHCFRRSGSTGTRGEQVFTSALGDEMERQLTAAGWEAAVVLADPGTYPETDLFIALHCDGSTNPAARGASAFYPDFCAPKAREWAAHWKARHQETAEYTGGFRRDNYYAPVANGFYAWKHSRRTSGRGVNSSVAMLVEHYFATNDHDYRWATSGGRIEMMARAHVLALSDWLGDEGPVPRDSGAIAMIGDRGDAVREIQRILQQYSPSHPGEADGIFGRKTHASVMAFQDKFGLANSGHWTVLEQSKSSELSRFIDGGPFLLPKPTPKPTPKPSPESGADLAMEIHDRLKELSRPRFPQVADIRQVLAEFDLR